MQGPRGKGGIGTQTSEYGAWEGLGSSTVARRNVPARAPAKEKTSKWLAALCEKVSERAHALSEREAAESERASERASALPERAREREAAFALARKVAHGILCSKMAYIISSRA